MKKELTGAFALITSVLLFLSGCTPEPSYYGKHVYRYKDADGNWWYSGGGPDPKSDDFGDIDCDEGLAGCQALYESLGGLGNVTVVRSSLDTVYHYYFRNDMASLYQKHNLHAMFPIVDIERPGALDFLASGKYQMKVGMEDSSIIIYEPSLSSKPSAIVYAFERDDYRPTK